MFEADLHCMRRAKVLTLGNSLLSLCSETTTELPKSTNVTFRVLIYKGLLGDVQGWRIGEQKSICLPWQSCTWSPSPAWLYTTGHPHPANRIRDSGAKSSQRHGLYLYLEYLDSTRGAWPVSSKTPHLLTFPHPIGLPKLVHEVRQEEGELLCFLWQQLHINLDHKHSYSVLITSYSQRRDWGSISWLIHLCLIHMRH